MIAAQYKIKLPRDYNMEIVEKRIRENGHKTDGFEGLYLKFYLVSKLGDSQGAQNCYCPLYLWNDHEGLNTFLFDGYYDNILNSFGWQNVNIGIPLITEISTDMDSFKYAYEVECDIDEKLSLKGMKSEIESSLRTDVFKNYVVIYNPDKWKYVVFYFSERNMELELKDTCVYRIKHISRG